MNTAKGVGQHEARPQGPAGFAIVLVVCAAASLIAWFPLGLPPRLLRWLLAEGSRGILSLSPGCGQPAASYVCSFEAGALAVFPAIVFSVVLFLMRKQLTRWLRLLLAPRLPGNRRFLVAPVIATLAFVLSWSYVHAASPFKFGLAPQVVFPVFVGLFTFATAQYGTSLARSASRLLDARDKLPVWVRVVAVILISLLVSIALMSQRPVTFLDLKQQLIVLLSLVIGYAALMPRADAGAPKRDTAEGPEPINVGGAK